MIEKPCPKCSGSGLTRKNQKIKLTIPPGMEDGKRLHIPGQGDAGGNSGAAGDLFVVVHVKDHEYYERDGSDLYCAIPIDIAQASLGADIMVATLDDRQIKVKIPAGTQNGKILRVRGEGIPVMNRPDTRGDLYLKIQVEIPRKLSAKARELLKEYVEVEGSNESPRPISLQELRNPSRD